MSGQWQYQIRINLEDEAATAAREDPNNSVLKPLTGILAKHRAIMKSQYDAFADYVAEAERLGEEDYPLYKWTKATIENPEKKEKYLKSFTLYVGGKEVYDRDIAEALEQDLKPLIGGGLLKTMAKHDTNPANNPQPPARYR